MTIAIEFASAMDARAARDYVKSLGHLDVETHSPLPISDDQAYAPRGSFPVAVVAFGGGVTGLAGAYFVQWYANVYSYALDIGGRPPHAAPAFVPSTFETICLLATMGVLVAFVVLERLPRLWQPIFDIDGFERASIDRFWLVFDVRSADGLDRLVGDLVAFQPLRVMLGEVDA